MVEQNTLYYGDNLKVLRQHVPDGSVDLIYLDPPFNSNATYNVLFAEQNGSQAVAQIKAFGDTWHWDENASRAWEDVVETGGRVSQAMQAFRQFLGDNDMLAYLSMMAPRLIELRRVLKTTGSIYLHCDSTASHYLKMLMDAVWGAENTRAEIIWKRTYAHGGATNYHRVHDVILYYTKTAQFTWNAIRVCQQESYLKSHYRSTDADGRRYQLITAHGAGQGPPRRFGDRIIRPPKGRHWMDQETIDENMRNGLIVFTRSGMPRKKRYLDETEGRPIPDVWDDIFPINSQAQERLGYPTQKPEALLDRIIQASSNEGDVVLDPFCGCGTAIVSAHRLGRRWIGVDITQAGIVVIKKRLRDMFGRSIDREYKVVGEPCALPDAQVLASKDPYQFQWWALGFCDARPTEGKKGADKGIDGRLYFHDEAEGGKTKQVIFSVKAGNLVATHVRDLRGVLEREKAQIAVLISMQKPTRLMRAEAASAGFYQSPWGTKHPRMQLVTVQDLLEGKAIDMPPIHEVKTFKRAAAVPKAGRPRKSKKTKKEHKHQGRLWG